MDDDQDLVQETTTGTGRLLFLFLGMVVLCAVFFGLGYSLGKNSLSATAQAAEPVPAATTLDAAKPSPLNPGEPGAQAQTPSTDQLTFYKSVEQKDQPTLAAKPSPAGAKPEANTPAAKEEARLAAAVGMTPAVATPPASATAPAAGYIVQIAAVRRQEDANALVKALRKKQYPVFVASNAPDKLFHVQVGPFSDPKEADAMKARLIGDGYKPIVKK
jgi:cell division septation protein DedD